MITRINLNRRSFFIFSGVAGVTGLLAACGGNSNTSSAETGSALTSGDDISKLVAINEHDRVDQQTGGVPNLAVATLGPNFNVAT